jgi:hypothetical protein
MKRFALGLERALKEVGGGGVGGEPVFVEQEAVELVGEDELVDGDVAGAEGLSEDGGLGVGDVGIIVAVDEEDGRAPMVDGGDGRAEPGPGGDGILLGEGALLPVGGVVFEVPVVDTVEVDAGGEEVGVTREAQSGEVATVAATPDADALGIDAGDGAQVVCRGEDIVVLGGAIRAGVLALTEVEAIADAAAVVDGEHDEALRGEVLVHRVGVGVVVHRRIAEEQLAIGSAMEKEDCGPGCVLGGFRVGAEELTVEVQAVDAGEQNLAGSDESLRIVGGRGVGAHGNDASVIVDEGGVHRHVRIGDEGGNGSVGGDLGMRLDAFAMGNFDGVVGVREVDAPEVTAVLVEGGRIEPLLTGEARISGRRLVGAVDKVAVVAAEGGVLDFERSWGKPIDEGIGVGMDLVEVYPSVCLAIELDGGIGGEEEACGAVGEVRKDAAGLIGAGREERARDTGGHIGKLNGPGVGRGTGGSELTRFDEGRAQPGDLVASGGEDRGRVVTGGGVEEAEGVGVEIVESEEAVGGLVGFAAMADEGEGVAVWGEREGAG